MAFVLGLWWLAEAEASPLRSYFLYHPMLSNILALLSFPAVIVGMLFSGNAHQPSEVVTTLAAAIEWFAFGYLLAVIVVPRRETR